MNEPFDGIKDGLQDVLEITEKGRLMEKEMERLRYMANDAIACGEPRQLLENLNHQFYHTASPKAVIELINHIDAQAERIKELEHELDCIYDSMNNKAE